MAEEVRVGTVLYGFCGGAFGRDSYRTKRVEAVGVDWVVARAIGRVDAGPEFARFASPDEMREELAKAMDPAKEI